MSTRKKQRNFIQRLLKRLGQSFNALTKGLVNGVLRSLMVFKRRSRQSQAGFVLPTVVMVMLVVALLTTAIVIRSFDRAKNASNYRIDEAVINAAKPALDRSRAKIDRLFSVEENRLAGGTPPEKGTTGSIENVLNQVEYTFGDETQLKIVDPTTKESLTTAWKFPADTDNNGKLDSYIIYGIYFRNPPDANDDDKPDRARTTIEARALPQATGELGGCPSGAAGSGAEGWYETSGQLKKAFFTYVAAVPITEQGTLDPTKYEIYKGKKGFSALEMQQDQARVSLDNNAVWYDDDLVISNVPTFRLNGRMHTNSNLMMANYGGDEIILYQVSSIHSCYYKPENAKIIVGGNVAAGDVTGDTDGNPGDATGENADLVKVHLYKGLSSPPDNAEDPPDENPIPNVNADNKTTKQNPADVASNINAYSKRLKLLVDAALYKYDGGDSTKEVTLAGVQATYPSEIYTEFTQKYSAGSARAILTRALEGYFANRIRRVSYIEVPFGGDPLGTYTITNVLTGFDPPDEWRLIDPAYSKIEVDIDGNTMELEAKDPDKPSLTAKVEDYIGDRILVGNALPRQWKDSTGAYVEPGTKQDVSDGDEIIDGNIQWEDEGSRYRIGRVQPVDDLGDTSRSGYWERAAALSGKEFEDPSAAELAGGLRVITGAGIYIDNQPIGTGTGQRGTNSFLPAPPTVAELIAMQESDQAGIRLPKEILDNKGNVAELAKYTVVWPDTMPMYQWKDTNNSGTYDAGEVLKGDLQMRATVVYHYNVLGGKGDQPTPLACISSYYDPTNADTAQNATGLPQNPSQKTTALGVSNNGVNYPESYASRTIDAVIESQAKMIFPDGRWVNEPLKRAVVDKGGDISKLSLDELAAVEAANCALGILKPGAAPGSETYVPNFAIQERAFLDARQVKSLHKRDLAADGTKLKDSAGADITRETLLSYITDPAKMKIAELGELSQTMSADAGALTPPPYYSLPIEQRQPLEIRVTEIDLGDGIGFRKKPAGTVAGGYNEYMLPNSGIIYATRDDALPDITDAEFDSTKPDYYRERGGSATDFKLDPTRRPNGIRLVNGKNLAREDDYRAVEKGLILASNLPVYIKGEFNLHVSPEDGTPREEFTDALELDPGIEYRNFYTRNELNPNFACRPNPNNPDDECDDGDSWRAARILSDAVTLLSRNFRDGYRTEGDYDINNNAGNLAVEARLKNGFWWNSFATSAQWYGNNGYPKTDFEPENQAGSSYLTNGVTPIQRRASFREYRMEICRKLPVSACGPTDWKLENPDAANPNVGSGTTAPYSNTAGDISYVHPRDRIYPRRVAFQRNAFGGLVLTNGKPAPIAADGSVLSYDATGSSNVASRGPINNALWYFTTIDNTDPAKGISYSNANNLYFPNVEEPEVPAVAGQEVKEKQLLLPGTPELGSLGVTLNGLTENDPSDFAVCTTNQNAKSYQPLSAPLGGVCDPTAMATIESVRQALLTWNPVGDPSVNLEELPSTAGTLTAKAKINIYTLPATNVTPSLDLTKSVPPGNWILDRGNQSDPIFIFRSNPAHAGAIDDFLNFPGVDLTLQGVDPNNIFWVASGRIAVKGPSKLAGTFIGSPIVKSAIANSGTLTFYGPNTNQIELTGRILGVSQVKEVTGNLSNIQMTALTKTDQPLLLPVLQLHSPQGTPPTAAPNATTGSRDNERRTAFGGTPINSDYWVQRVSSDITETYNAVFIMGDSPSRPFPNNQANRGESGGGLGNFPRFLEAWENNQDDDSRASKAKTKIFGSFIQFKKSFYATAPFEQVDDPTKDNSLFFDSATPGAVPDYMANFTPATEPTPDRSYLYKGGASGRKAAYYRPPQRFWGYDVGLLSQSADLFSRRFANPTAGTPNEYYREVSKSDKWIQTLLCAAEDKGGSYDWALPEPQRPNCQVDLGDFN